MDPMDPLLQTQMQLQSLQQKYRKLQAMLEMFPPPRGYDQASMDKITSWYAEVKKTMLYSETQLRKEQQRR